MAGGNIVSVIHGILQTPFESILDAGCLASSGMNLQHWRFVLLDEADDLDTIGDLGPSGGWVAETDFAIAILIDPEYPFHEIDAGQALTYMQVAAWETEVGSRIYTVDESEDRDFLTVTNEYALTAIVGFGYPVREIRGQKDRKPLTEIAFSGSFGEPLQV